MVTFNPLLDYDLLRLLGLSSQIMISFNAFVEKDSRSILTAQFAGDQVIFCFSFQDVVEMWTFLDMLKYLFALNLF